MIMMLILIASYLALWGQADRDTTLVTEAFARPPQSDSQSRSRDEKLVKEGRSRLLDRHRAGIAGLWSEWYEELEKLADHQLKQDQLPEFSWLSPMRENRASNLKKIQKLSRELLIEVKNPEVERLRTHYFELKSKINDDLLAARKAVEDSYQAPREDDAYFWQTHRGDYVELKKRKEAAVKAHQAEQQKVISECHDHLVQLGVELTPQQVEQLFRMSSGELMITLFSTFAQLNLLGEYVTERMREAQDNEDYAYLAKRYYAVYVAIVALTLDIHEHTREKLLTDHIPRLDQLGARLKKVLKSTYQLAKNEEARVKKLKRSLRRRESEAKRAELEEAESFLKQLRVNLKVQLRAREGIKAYRAHVVQQVEKIKLSSRKISRRLKIAFNTYQTVLIGTDQFDLMREGLRDLSNLQKIQVPAMVPLAGERITEHLDLISRHFDGDESLPSELTGTFKR